MLPKTPDATHQTTRFWFFNLIIQRFLTFFKIIKRFLAF